jgi:DNA-directed RNA polymerase specialized sigma24 family protein
MVAVNVSRDAMRAEKRRNSRDASAEVERGIYANPSPSADSAFLAAEVLETMANALSASELRLLQLLLDGATVAKVAEVFGCGYSTAGVRIHRLRRKIAQILEHSA